MARLQGINYLASIVLIIILQYSSQEVVAHNKTANCPPCQCQCPSPSAAPNANQDSGSGGSDAGLNVHVDATIAEAFQSWIQFVGNLPHSHFPTALNHFDPIRTITVDKNAEAGHFTCIQEAINSVPLISFQRVVIKIGAGVYTEKLSISPLRAFITLEGQGADQTIIQWGADAHVGLGAFASATLAVNAPYFIAKNITFKNTASVAAVGAGVAVRVSADTAFFQGCTFISAHNTLYDHIGRHYYKECSIQGGVDFIFGQALSLFEGCFLEATAEANGAASLERGVSLLANAGLSFTNCKLAGSAVFYLGRAWGTFSRTVFTNCFFDHVELPKGLKLSADAELHLSVFFGVHKCFGPGIDFALKSSWATELTFDQVKPFTTYKFIDGPEWVKCSRSDN